jgi:predicted GNAT family acetyltransferase
MSAEIKLSFQPGESSQDISEIYNFNVKAFADAQDFNWSEESIKQEMKDGWILYSARFQKDIVAALFLKVDGDKLLTKNTPIKLTHQGNGFSHIIKEFYEQFAKDNSLNKIINYCAADNFRMISLNEGHDYKKTGRTTGPNNDMIEWEKEL